MTRFQINPGEFRHVLTFQKRTETQNAFGEVINEWVDVFKTRGAIYPVSGRDFFAGEQINSEVTHKINLRYAKGLSPDMRIEFNGRVFEIESIINFQEANTLLQMMCKELIVDG